MELGKIWLVLLGEELTQNDERTSMINNVNIYSLHSSVYVRGAVTLTGNNIYKQQDTFGHVESRFSE